MLYIDLKINTCETSFISITLYVNSVHMHRNTTLKSALICKLVIIIFISSVPIIYGDGQPLIKRLSDHDQAICLYPPWGVKQDIAHPCV